MDIELLERFRNRWVAIQNDGTVLTDAADLDGLLTKLKMMPDSNASIQRIPAANEPLFVGLR
jgi:Family of unknown function (DUF5678)